MPIFLYNEYKTFANLYFLMLALSQLVPALSVGLMITYFGPIVVVLGLSMIKELWDHFKTIKKDNNYNNEMFTQITISGEEKLIRSKKIKVGYYMKLQKNQRVPVRLSN